LTAQQIKLLCARASCFIGSDSGPAHIAACTDVPMVVLYTIAPVEYFLPEREKGVTLPIKADIECQGCLRNVKLGEGLNCKREMQYLILGVQSC
jgi:ADP-heptose:LPS heptosyltransferase